MFLLALASPTTLLAAQFSEAGVAFVSGKALHQGVRFQPIMAIEARGIWTLRGPLEIAANLRYYPSVALEGRAVGLETRQVAARFQQLAPGFLLRLKKDFGITRFALGSGFSYYTRFVDTAANVKHVYIDAAHPEYGTIRSIELVDHPGFDAQGELSLGNQRWRFALGGGLSYAVSRVIFQPQENRDVFIGRPLSLSAWIGYVGIRRTFDESVPPKGSGTN